MTHDPKTVFEVPVLNPPLPKHLRIDEDEQRHAQINAAMADAVHEAVITQASAREERIVEAIDRYLLDIHSSNWGRSFAIERPDNRQQAVAFIRTTLEGISETLLKMDVEESARIAEAALADYEARRGRATGTSSS